MVTLEQVKNLQVGDYLYHVTLRDSDGSPSKWKVTGQVKTWKLSPGRVRVPLKRGLKGYDYLDEALFTTDGDCPLFCLTPEEALND